MKNTKVKNAISLAMNVINAVLVLISVLWFFTDEGRESGAGNMGYGGAGCFMFFTNDSNILAAICGLIIAPFNIKSIRNGKTEIPEWALTLKFIGTVAVTVTLVTVLVFLGPILTYSKMFEGNCLALHLICPLLCIFSFCFFEDGMHISPKQALWGVLPTFIYGNVYLINVIFAKVWSDFYHFNIGGFWYISYVVMMAASYLLALGTAMLHNRNE